MSATQIMLYGGIGIGAVIGLWALDRLALWMERRGWIYWRKRRPQPGSTGSAFLMMQSFIQPEIREVIEAEHQEKAEVKGEQGEVMQDEGEQAAGGRQ